MQFGSSPRNQLYARRTYRLADHCRTQGVIVALGELHVTSLPDETADKVFLGPGDQTQLPAMRPLLEGGLCRSLRRHDLLLLGSSGRMS